MLSRSWDLNAAPFVSVGPGSLIFFLDLAEELLLHVLSHMSRNELLCVSATCRSLRPLGFEPSLSAWSTILYVDSFSQPSNALQFLTNHPVAPLTKVRQLRFDRVSSVAAYLSICGSARCCFEHVETVCIGDSRHFASFFEAKRQEALFYTVPNMRRLHFSMRLSAHLAQISQALAKSRRLEVLSFEDDKKRSTTAWVEWLYSRSWNGSKLFETVPSLLRVDERSPAATLTSPLQFFTRPIDILCARCNQVLFSKIRRYWIAPPSQQHISFELLTSDAYVETGTSNSLWADDVRLNCINNCHRKQWLIDCGSAFVDRHGFKFAIACGTDLATAVYSGTSAPISSMKVGPTEPDRVGDPPPLLNV